MRIAIGADHRGFELKSKLISFLKKQGHDLLDLGTDSTKPCDYPAIGYNVAKSVSSGKAKRGILICASGIGMSIIANKVPGVRAAMCSSKEDSQLSREHNDANIIIISAKFLKDNPEEMLKIWLKADITEDRHKKRVSQIKDIEGKILKGEM